ncbi:conserved hypothetical protein [Culex quinquefasciatus]|uniref:Uncharacterized protein n=1 Tax=Culex quinquefasciatus TaxID=7176 RepID=B0XHS3_CULQU|nr:conserved hypothetical protein [Culex quinquefasciatus]|eukprot:XP_001869195.1 conserved hypothetical protein [Culex quinquefasciatus]
MNHALTTPVTQGCDYPDAGNGASPAIESISERDTGSETSQDMTTCHFTASRMDGWMEGCIRFSRNEPPPYGQESKSYENFWFNRLNKKISGNGYHYRVHTKRLQPYFYYDAESKLTGLDDELMQTISKSQNATIEYFMYEDNYPIWVASQDDPQLKYTYDMSLRIGHKPERDLLDKVFLPEWEELCVTVPKKQHRLMILQLTKPFQLEVWIFCVVFIAVRTYATIHFCQTAYMAEHSESNFNPLTNDKYLFILEERLGHLHNFYGFAWNHPLKAIFERKLRYVFESGVWRKIYDRYWTKEEQFRKLLTPNRYPIDFVDLISLWIMVVVGWMVSFVWFAGEIFIKIQKNR